MGYRHYFYKVAKSEVEKVKDMTIDEIFEYAKSQGAEVEEQDNYFDFIDDKFMNKQEIYELGKLYFDDTADRIYSKGIPLFSNKEVDDAVNDYCPYVVGKEGLLETIKIYQEKTLNYYKSFIVNDKNYSDAWKLNLKIDEIKNINEIVKLIENKIFNLLIPDYFVDTNERHKWSLTHTWDYEYTIFSLVHILKTIDWEKDTLLFYGW